MPTPLPTPARRSGQRAPGRLLAATGLAALALSASACGSDTSAGSDPGTSTSTVAGAFKAGTYSADGDYQNPDGPASVGVEVTIDAAGVIGSVEVTPHTTSGNGALFQKLFADNIADVVVGKPIAEADVDKVAGSSLTGAGFNAALEAIIAQAS